MNNFTFGNEAGLNYYEVSESCQRHFHLLNPHSHQPHRPRRPRQPHQPHQPKTICGGTGAGPDHDGCDAVHSHMTNTRLTDPEILEFRFPLMVDSFDIRRGSGGAGEFRGGDGIIRKVGGHCAGTTQHLCQPAFILTIHPLPIHYQPPPSHYPATS
jgi:hypothetical protein